MSILDALQRGWWQGVSAWPEYVGGGLGLIEDIIPGKQDWLEEQEQLLKRTAEDVRGRGPEGESTGLLEKIAEGIGAAPVDITTYLPAGVAAKGLGITGKLAAPAFTFGVTSAIRAGGEGLPQSIGQGLRGAAEGAAFGGVGKYAERYMSPAAKRLLAEKSSLLKTGTAEAAEKARLMEPQIQAALDSIGSQATRRTIHAVGAGGIPAVMTLAHGGSVEDAASAFGTMGILGALGGMTPKQIREAGKYRDPYTETKIKLDELEGLAKIEGEKRLERIAKEVEESPGQDVIREVAQDAGAGPLSDLAAAGQKARPPEMFTESLVERIEGWTPAMREVVTNANKERGPYQPRTNEDTKLRAAERIYRDKDGKLQAAQEDIDAMAWHLNDLQNVNNSRLGKIDALLARAIAEGDEVGIQRYRAEKDAQVLKAADDYMQFLGVRSSVGNALRVLGTTKRGTPDWVKSAEIVKKKLGTDADRVVKMLEMSQDNPELMVRITEAINQPKAWDYFQEYWINGLLSGPPTHMVNIMSNAYRSVIDMAEKSLALRSMAKEGIITKEQARGEMKADLTTAMNTFKVAEKAFREGLRSEDFDISTLDPRYEVFKRTQKQDYPSKVIGGTAGKIVRFPGRALQAMDLAFKTLAGERAASAESYRLASEAIKRGEITEGQRIEYEAKLRGADGGTPDKRILEAMRREAEKQTFTERMPSKLAPVEKLRQTEFMGTKPLVAVLPFMSTPFNVIKQAVARSPLGYLRFKDLKQRYERGDISAKEFYQERAATNLGTAMTAALVGLAKAGLITGGGPVNQQDRQNLIDTGWRPYSIHVPGFGYIQAQRIEPFGTILGMAGDIAEFGDSEDKMGKLIATIKDNLTDKSFLYGLESLSKAWSNPEMFASTYYRQMSGSLVPTLFAKAAQAVDPYARDTEALRATVGVPDAMAYRIPGLSQELPLRSTPMGTPQERWGTLGTADTGEKVLSALQSMASSVPFSTEREGKEVEKELDRLRGFPGMPPATPRRSKTLVLRGVHGDDVKLNEAEYGVYNKYHSRAKEALSKIIQSPNYQMLPDGHKAKLLRSTYDKFRSAANREINAMIRRRTTVGE